jgi:hypothetical protein
VQPGDRQEADKISNTKKPTTAHTKSPDKITQTWKPHQAIYKQHQGTII